MKYATTCHICEKELGEDRVIDHCHLTGKFRGAAHKKCNLNYRIPNFIPVFFHNLSGYDSHLFIKKIKTNVPTEYHIKLPRNSILKSLTGKEWVTHHVTSEGDISCIPKTEENYITFGKKITVDAYLDEGENIKPVKREIRFLDSYKFMSASLDTLSKNLSDDQCKNLSNMYSGKQFNLMRRKGVFPH